jgi:hypothetical protein
MWTIPNSASPPSRNIATSVSRPIRQFITSTTSFVHRARNSITSNGRGQADLRGRVALVTEAASRSVIRRNQIAARGAGVIVTYAISRNSADRYSREADFESWSSLVKIYGLDLRHAPSVEHFAGS